MKRISTGVTDLIERVHGPGKMPERVTLVGGLGLVALCVAACGQPSTDLGQFSSGADSTETDTGDTSEDESTDDGGDGDDTETDSGDGGKFDVGEMPDPDPPPVEIPKTCQEALETPSSVGCTFFPADVPSPNFEIGISASNLSSEIATVTLSDIDGELETVQLDPGETHLFVRDDLAHKMSFVGSEIGQDGYLLESDFPIQVFQIIPPFASATADASIVLPQSALGTRHRAVGIENGYPTTQYLVAVATEDDTEVTFTLEHPGSFTEAGGGLSALDYDNGEESFTVQLDRLEHIVISSPTHYGDNDEVNAITGSLLESDKPVAVYGGHRNILLWAGANDLVSTAIPPARVYGERYAGVKFIPVGNEYDQWRFIADHDDTTIELSGGVEDTITLDAGEYQDVETTKAFWAEGDQPFGLVHIMTGSSAFPPVYAEDCDVTIGGPGDPAIGWVYPRGNWLNRYLMPVGPTIDPEKPWCHDHITVVSSLSRWDEIMLNDEPLPPAVPLGDSGQGYTYVTAPEEFYELEAPSDVAVEVSVYGYRQHGSYFYPGGMGLRELNPEG